MGMKRLEVITIKNRWYAVLESIEVKHKPIVSQDFQKNLCLLRVKRCLNDQCIYSGVELSLREVHGDYLHCPFHGFVYNNKG